MLALLYYAYLNLLMLRRVHGLGASKAFAALFVPALLLVLVLLVASGGAAAQAVV